MRLMTFWNNDDFKKLNQAWKIKLKESGFIDVEDSKGNLIQKDHRTNAFASKDATQEFFNALGEYLNTNVLSPRDRFILELYSEGVYINGKNGIIEQTGWSDRTIRNIITKHKKVFTCR